MKLIIAGIGIAIIITIGILAIAIATLVKVSNQTNDRPYVDTSSTTTTTKTTPGNLVLAESIRIDDVMNYLKELQRIATANNGNRAITTTGFNETLHYIINTLAINTNYKVSTQLFPIRQFALDGIPIFNFIN
ncbi:unnamed protein product [Rotaria sordida]|uniref:Uncharacterized protein n=1 Tax=Rotaria sordida TaxID=392033 RepID=A0A815XUZ1_9BILA|nr:unnamed protein product [Rotaria sordida]CAF4251631.1 unnamed protein product [Rotaria sordida]